LTPNPKAQTLDARFGGGAGVHASGGTPKIISMFKWIRTSRLSIKNSLFALGSAEVPEFMLLAFVGGSLRTQGQVPSEYGTYKTVKALVFW